MKFGFVGFDVGPAKALALIAKKAQELGHETVVVPPQQEGAVLSYFQELASCDAVAGVVSSFRVIGSERFPVFDEVLLIHALDRLPRKVPYVIVEDVPGSSLHPQAKAVSGKVAAVITAIPSWIDRVRNAEGFSYNDVFCLGPPVHWEDSYKKIKSSWVDVRHNLSKVRGQDKMDVDSSDKVVFYGGGKDPRRDNGILEVIICAGVRAVGDDFVLLFKRHPGEGQVDDPEAFRQREELLKDVWMVNFGTYTMPELIGASDLTVFSGGNTDSITAAYARVPSVYYYDDEVLKTLKEHGIARWFVAEEGGSLKTEGREAFEDGVEALLSARGYSALVKEDLRKTQESAFPVPNDWDTAPKIVKYLEKLAS